MIRLLLKVNPKMMMQATMLKLQRVVSGESNLNAPWATVIHLARTPKGPIKDKAMKGNQNPITLPYLPKKTLESPSKKSMAKIPKKGTKTPVNKIPAAAKQKCPPHVCPTTSGNTKLPEPKNMENMARPVDKIRVLFFMEPIIENGFF